MSPSSTPRQPIRSLFSRIVIGRHQTGPSNTLTDVPGVLVSTQSLHKPNTSTPESIPGADASIKTKHAINTGVTVILPRKNWFKAGCYAGIFRFNGSGELTGSHWIEETGMLTSPIVVTSSFAVGSAYEGIYKYASKEHSSKDSGLAEWFLLPVVGETYDGYLTDVGAMPIRPEMIVRGIEMASSDPVKQGNAGGGTGMVCQGFKGGTGSASRVIKGTVKREGKETEVQYTVAALVQANYGAQWDLHIGRVPVGKLMMDPAERAKWEKDIPKSGERDSSAARDGSIIIVLATDAPLLPLQLQRLAKRATVGLARVGGYGTNMSGDIFIAFSTAGKFETHQEDRRFDTVTRDKVDAVVDDTIHALFECAVDCTEEAIYNALCLAEDMEGPKGKVVKGIDLDHLKELLEKHYVD